MPISSHTHSSPALADVVALMQALAAAPDSRAFFAALCRALPGLLPDTRADLLVSDWADGMCLPLVGDAGAPPAPPEAGHNADMFAAWLAGCGYSAVAMQPLAGAGQHLGWLVLARRAEPFDTSVLALAGQLAAFTALRLAHEQSRDALAQRDDAIAGLERRLLEHDELRLRATLAVGTVHDIGNLLAAVVGHAQMAQREAPAMLQHDLQTIERAARDGNALLRRLIALKSAAPAVPAGQAVLLPSLVHDALELTRPFWEARYDIEIRTALAPGTLVRAEAADVREVIVNLIINALAAMPSSGSLTLRSYTDEPHGLLDVIDTGQGIAPEYQARIFQPLEHMREQGRGLGLSVCRALAESYGGTLRVKSAPGQGATFTLVLPRAEPSELALGAALAHATR